MSNGLVKYSPNDQRLIEKMVLKHSSTNGRNLELRRIELGTVSLGMDGLIREILDTENGLSESERAAKSNTANLLGLSGMVKGLELIVDCLSLRSKVKLANGQEGRVRMTLADMTRDVAACVANPEDGMAVQLDDLSEMINDIGISWKSFKDEKGEVFPTKYRQPLDPNAQPSEVMDENEAVSDAESEVLASADPLEKIRKGKN